jgi:Leucine-rich repeat (LRR) protein
MSMGRVKQTARVPVWLPKKLPNLEQLNVAHNKLDTIPNSLSNLKILRVDGNPLSSILPAYRSTEKVCAFIYLFFF